MNPLKPLEEEEMQTIPPQQGAAAISPTPKLPGMPSGTTVDEITPYLNAQRVKLNRFGPSQQADLQKSLNARRDSLGYKATSGLKGFADALMMGVAGAGNPGWQQQFAEGENRYAQDQQNSLKESRQANLQQVESGMSLDKMDPNSQLSKTQQQAYSPLFQKLGYDPSKLNGMSSANIDNTMALMAQFGGKEMEAMIKQYELEIERARLAAAAGNSEAQAQQAANKSRVDAAKEILDKDKNTRVLGMPIPFTSPISGDEADAAKKVLTDQVGNGQDDEPVYIKTAVNKKTRKRIGTRDGKNWEPIQ